MCAGWKRSRRRLNRIPDFASGTSGHSLTLCYNDSSAHTMTDLKSLIREIPDFPKPGILFYDITTLLKDKEGWRSVIDSLKDMYKDTPVDVVVGIEARGFFFAPTLAYALGAGFVPVRKPKKLPGPTVSVEYALEYGTDRLEIHQDAIQPGQKVLVLDDVLATGGTASAVARLVEQLGGELVGLGFVVELDFLHGRDKLAGRNVQSLLHY
jgi:adenine phosphoribosyltransferase